MGREGDGIRKLVAVDHLVIGHRRAQHFDHVAVAAQRVAVVDIGDGAHHVTIRLRYASNARGDDERSEEHTSELQSLMRITYAVFCLKKKNITHTYLSRTSINILITTSLLLLT